MRQQILEALRTKHVPQHIFMPLMVHDFFETLPDYDALLRADATETQDDGYPTIGERFRYFLSHDGIRYRLKFGESIHAAFLGWCQGTTIKGECDPSVTIECEVDGLESTFVQHTPIGSLTTKCAISPVSTVQYITERPLKTLDDVKVYKYIVEAGSVSANYAPGQEQLDLIGEAGIFGGAGFSCPFHELLYMFDAEDFLVMSFDMPAEVKGLIHVMHAKAVEAVKVMADSPIQVFDHECIWDARQISPKLHTEWYVPYQREYNDIFHASGKLVYDHLSGQEFEPYLDGLEACQHDMVYGITLEAHKIDDLVALVDRWEGKVVPSISPSPDFLRRQSANDVRRLVETFLAKLGDHKVIMGSADALVPHTPPENLAAVSAAQAAAE
ncbi:MAG: uroporphyrinogen decarboxylase family protein [Planctomycetota bacterium]|jgi:uroporphyrinogen-III decarboxylase